MNDSCSRSASKDHGVEVVGVSFPDRMIELVVMPYEHPAMIHEPGRSYEEIVAGARSTGSRPGTAGSG